MERRDLVVAAWSALLAALLLGPALAPGYVLSYDMVWVPDLALGRDALGLASGLPRAVPSDAVVSVLDEVVPGMLLQKLVLLGSLVAGAVGAARLTGGGAAAGLVAATVWTWNPYVVERLVIGHWPLLVGYAVLPWVLLAGARWRRDDRLPPVLLVLLPLGSLSASSGVMTAVAVLAVASTRRWSRWAASLGLLLAANAPWVVSGVLHAADAVAATGAFDAFGPGSEGGQPPPVAALALGGIWNADVVPASREGWQGWAYLVVLVLVAAVGARACRHRTRPARSRGLARALVVCWAVGYAVLLLTWVAPGPLDRLAAVVPGLALLRDGSRTLALCAPLVAVLVGRGAEQLVRAVGARWPGATPAVAATVCLVLWPLALLPDAAWGVNGRLQAVSYPPEVLATAGVLARSDVAGATAVLPFTAYRAPEWNGGRPVLDPLPRLLGGPVVSSDELVVSGRTVPGEDPRARAVRRALEAETPRERARGLAQAGVGAVVVDREARGPVPEVAGERVRPVRTGERGGPSVLLLPDAEPRVPPLSWRVAMTLAWVAFVLLPAAGVAAGVTAAPVAARRRRHGRPGTARAG